MRRGGEEAIIGGRVPAVSVVTVYDDVDPVMHEWAKLSLLAHLIKLEGEGRTLKSSVGGVEHWALVA